MTDLNWLSLMLLLAGASLILIEAYAFSPSHIPPLKPPRRSKSI